MDKLILQYMNFGVDHNYHNWNRTLMSESDLQNTV